VGGGGKGGEAGASNVPAPAAFPRFPRAGKALLFVRAPFCRATDNDPARPPARRDLGISRN